MADLELPDSMFAAPDPVAVAPPPVDPAVRREQNIADTTRAEEALNGFLVDKQHALFEAPDAFYRTEGPDAIHAAPVILGKLNQLREQSFGDLANDAQRDRLGPSLDAQLQLARDDIARHVAEQSLAWQRKTAQDRIALLTKEAAYHHNDTDLVDAIGHAAATAARAHARVGDTQSDQQAEDAAAATARSAVLAGVIQARLDRGDTQGANALLTQVNDQLDPGHSMQLLTNLGESRQGPKGPTTGNAAILSEATPGPIEDGQRFDPADEAPSLSLEGQSGESAKPASQDGKIQPKIAGVPSIDLPTTGGSPVLEPAADNQRENKMVRDIQVQLQLTREQREQLHREISGRGYTYQEILIEAKGMFGK